ncbi:MAG: type II toxin-antitoxin system RelE/ParE family toxin [Spirulina sp. SIO3F2]|nr:type II toxin-antitoxin system RelE/ParE family toxin [Spirulina sp. SIO3F2]
MIFQVRITQQAEVEIETAYRWLRKWNSADYADRWFRGLMNKLATLQKQPQRCALAIENDVFSEEVRQLLHGKRRSAYRILFVVRTDVVFILHVRSSRQAPLTAEDLVDEG